MGIIWHPTPMHGLGNLARTGFSVRERVCKGHVRSEGDYPCARIAVILDGTFCARSTQGSALLHAGGLLLGNPGRPYSYHYLDAGGTRAVVFDYHGALLDEAGGRAFDRASVPAETGSAAAVALVEEAVASGEPMALEEAAHLILERALGGGHPAERMAVRGGGQESRVARALRYIDAHFAEDCSLERLAAEARLSKFHLVRRCRALTGQTPRQLVIARRLRAAARALRTRAAPIIEIAMASGFGDLSHFNSSFARAFGVTPGAYRGIERGGQSIARW